MLASGHLSLMCDYPNVVSPLLSEPKPSLASCGPCLMKAVKIYHKTSVAGKSLLRHLCRVPRNRTNPPWLSLANEVREANEGSSLTDSCTLRTFVPLPPMPLGPASKIHTLLCILKRALRAPALESGFFLNFIIIFLGLFI